MSFDENGKAENENQSVKIFHNTFEWDNFLKQLTSHNYCRVDVLSANYYSKEFVNGEFKEEFEAINNLDSFKKEVKDAFDKLKEEVLTPEQKRIAELEAKLDALTSAVKPKSEKAKEVVVGEEKEVLNETQTIEQEPTNEEMSLKDQYFELLGKKPFNGWDEETIKQKMEEFKSQQ